ncbi:MAG: hypothetical protein QOE36_2868, partial [Gaiellaceae bacterium]|nr:hypothetical protein [Gaiellaceae bacterium]
MSLRARLVLGVILLGAVGLAVADVATYASLRSFLLQRTDSALTNDHIAVESALRTLGTAAPCDAVGRAVPGVYVQLRTRPGGAVVCSTRVIDFSARPAPPGR